MKLFIVMALLLVAVSAGAQTMMGLSNSEGWTILKPGEPGQILVWDESIEKWEWSVPEAQVADITISPIKTMSFQIDATDEYATLTWEGGIFKFSGDPDKSAVVFLDWVQQHYNERAKLYCPQNAEIKALLERANQTIGRDAYRITYDEWDKGMSGDKSWKGTARKRFEENLLLQDDIEAMIERMK